VPRLFCSKKDLPNNLFSFLQGITLPGKKVCSNLRRFMAGLYWTVTNLVLFSI